MPANQYGEFTLVAAELRDAADDRCAAATACAPLPAGVQPLRELEKRVRERIPRLYGFGLAKPAKEETAVYIDHVGINTNDIGSNIAILLRYTGHAISPHYAYARWASAL